MGVGVVPGSGLEFGGTAGFTTVPCGVTITICGRMPDGGLPGPSGGGSDCPAGGGAGDSLGAAKGFACGAGENGWGGAFENPEGVLKLDGEELNPLGRGAGLGRSFSRGCGAGFWATFRFAGGFFSGRMPSKSRPVRK